VLPDHLALGHCGYPAQPGRSCFSQVSFRHTLHADLWQPSTPPEAPERTLLPPAATAAGAPHQSWHAACTTRRSGRPAPTRWPLCSCIGRGGDGCGQSAAQRDGHAEIITWHECKAPCTSLHCFQPCGQHLQATARHMSSQIIHHDTSQCSDTCTWAVSVARQPVSRLAVAS